MTLAAAERERESTLEQAIIQIHHYHNFNTESAYTGKVMQFADLGAFIAVYETGSVSRAAEVLHLTQPAVTRRVQSLESTLGTPLFDRVGKKLLPSPAGLVFLDHARRLLAAREDARRAIVDLGERVAGPLRLVTSHHIGLHRLAPVLRDFNRSFPDVSLDIQFEDSEAAHDLVRSGSHELAVVTLDPRGEDELRYESIWPDPLEFVIAADHPLSRQADLQLQDLSDMPAILPGPSTYTGRIVLALFNAHGLRLQTRMSTNYLETIGMLVAAGLGWSVLPATLLGPELCRLCLPVGVPARMLGVVTNPTRTLSNAATAFQTVLRTHRTTHES
jgi:DNA-binding transcriptional LysR family regulator